MKYKSLFDIWQTVCHKYKDSVAFLDNKNGLKITYKQSFRILCFLSQKLKEFGLERFDHVSLFASNSPYWLIVEQAVITLGGVIIAKSPEIIISELEYVYEQSDSKILITDSVEILKGISSKNDIKFVLYMGEATDCILENENKIYFLSEILRELTDDTPLKTEWQDFPDDIAYISYTSGTSSQPKGAMLKNMGMACVLEQLEMTKIADIGQTAVVTCHISSMGWKAENLIYWLLGCQTVYTHYCEFYETIKKFKPDYFQIPPKILQTIHTKLSDNLNEQNFLFQKLFNIAFAISKSILKGERRVPFLSKIDGFIKKSFDLLFYKKIRNSMFKDNVLMDVGSAPLPRKLEDFYQIIGIRIVQSYGATETTGIVIGNTVQSQKEHPYSVGVPYKYNEIRIVNPETKEEVKKGNSGLLQIKGPAILQSYYKNEEATKKALVSDGFYNTGDICVRDKDGYITILSRCDDVLVLTNGYNVYTRLLENEVKDSEYINQIVIVGHAKPYLTALVVVNPDKCSNNPDFKEFLLDHLNEKIKRKDKYKYYEKLKDIYICPEDFTVENGLIAANTMKILYNAVYEKYGNVIESMYRK